jgi:biopolymer transport protein ExbD
VILIIFIITASAIFRAEVPLDLPQAQSAEEAVSGLLNVGITSQGQIYINGRPGELGDLPAAVKEMRRQAASKKQGSVRAYVSADVKAQYGTFAQVVDRLRLEGVTEIALDTDPRARVEDAR